MEKLIELLNEYEWKKTYKEYMDYQINEELPYKLDSLKVLKWFIKRLVENDKLNFKEFDERPWKYLEYPIWSKDFFEVYSYKDVIMKLSISDTPIDDLISYLK